MSYCKQDGIVLLIYYCNTLCFIIAQNCEIARCVIFGHGYWIMCECADLRSGKMRMLMRKRSALYLRTRRMYCLNLYCFRSWITRVTGRLPVNSSHGQLVTAQNRMTSWPAAETPCCDELTGCAVTAVTSWPLAAVGVDSRTICPDIVMGPDFQKILGRIQRLA